MLEKAGKHDIVHNVWSSKYTGCNVNLWLGISLIAKPSQYIWFWWVLQTSPVEPKRHFEQLFVHLRGSCRSRIAISYGRLSELCYQSRGCRTSDASHTRVWLPGSPLLLHLDLVLCFLNKIYSAFYTEQTWQLKQNLWPKDCTPTFHKGK